MLIIVEIVRPLVVVNMFTSSLRLLREVEQYGTSNPLQLLFSGFGGIKVGSVFVCDLGYITSPPRTLLSLSVKWE